MGRTARTLALYAQIGRTYRAWAPSLLSLAAVVFIPIGFVHALVIQADIGSLDFDAGVKLVAIGAAVAVLTATGLFGEVFYTGAVAISLTHPQNGDPPSLRETVAMVSYRRLIVIDLIYGAVVSVGIVALVVPGVIAFIYLGLAAPVAEIERRGVRAAFGRSFELVRGSFAVAAAVLIPLELIGDSITDLVTELAHDTIGESLLATWTADALSNIALTPFYAVAAVLLTLDLIARRDGTQPRLRSTPAG